MKIKNGEAILWDCLVEMKNIPNGSIDCIITDPPYGTTNCKWDTVIHFDLMWSELKRVIKPNGAIVLFGSEPFSSDLRMSNLKMYKYDWIWDKKRPSNFFSAKFQPLNDTENICVFSFWGVNNGSKTPCSYFPQRLASVNRRTKNSNSVGGKVWDAHSTSMKRGGDYLQENSGYPKKTLSFIRDASCIHPTQKPVALIEYLIKTYTTENETVLDFTAWSFTTAVACENTNRKWICIEKDENYFKIGIDRVENTK